MSPVVRVVLMVLREDELLLVPASRDPARLEFPSTVLVVGEAFTDTCVLLARNQGVSASVEPVFQRLANIRTAEGVHEVHVGFLVSVAKEFEPSGAEAGRFFPVSALPDSLDAVARDALAALSQQKGFVDLAPARAADGEAPAPSERSVASVDFLPASGEVASDPTRAAGGAGAATDDRVTQELTDFPESERITPEFSRPAPPPRAPSLPPPLPGELATGAAAPVTPFALWFAGALVWATSIALTIEHQQAAPADVVFVAWGTLVVTALLVISRASLPRAKDEDPPPIRRWLLLLGGGLSTLFFVALLLSVFAPVRAGGAYFLLGVIGMGLFFLARERAAKNAPRVQRTRFAEAGRLSLWLFLVFVSLFVFVVGPG